MLSRNLIIRILTILGIFMVVGYSFFALKDVLRGPRIDITTPQTGYATTTPMIAVAGRVLRGNLFFINNATTTIDLEGNFTEQLLLSSGYNIMTFEARDRYGRTSTETIEMILVIKTATSTSTSTTTEIVTAGASETATSTATSTEEN